MGIENVNDSFFNYFSGNINVMTPTEVYALDGELNIVSSPVNLNIDP